jgi:hypothetical protein
MEFSEITKQYWTKEDWKDLEKISSFLDMQVIAKRVLDRIPRPVAGVCGPIAETGGLHSVEANLNVFNNTIIQLQKTGLKIFDQMPFENKIQELKAKMNREDFLRELNDDFYMPIFESKIVSTFYFIPGWETSNGAKFEHEKAKELGIKIVYL